MADHITPQFKLQMGKQVTFQCSGKEEDICLDEALRTLLREDDSAANLLRGAQYEKAKYQSIFLKLPIGLTLEAQAFGANVLMDSKGLRLDNYPYSSLSEFLIVKPVDYNSGIAGQIMECIRLSSKDEPVLLKLTGAFSVLASLIDPMQLYKGMKKDKEALHQALEMINEWLICYAREALKYGVKVLSFADPMGFHEVTGDAAFTEFVGYYQQKLFMSLTPFLDNAVLHICGRNSVDLERCGFMKSECLPCTNTTYGKELLQRAEESDFHFCGHGCILEEGEYQQWIWKLTLE